MPLPYTEKILIERIRRRARPGTQVRQGIGDDCAVIRLPHGQEALVTTDFSLEGVHFRREWHPPDSVGHRCLTRGLSDIAAMGGDPIAAFLSLAAPRDLPQFWINRFFDGLLGLANESRVTLAGGDIAESPAGVLADIVVLGSVARGQAILRSGAHMGDLIYVTGELGLSSAVLQKLLAKERVPAHLPKYARHFYPSARIDVARFLREKKIATAMIDTSDGLSTDLAHICEESHVGAEIEAAAIPCAPLGKQPVDLRFALHGGEDYELIFTAPNASRIPDRILGVRVSRIGHIVRGNRIRLKLGNGRLQPLSPRGWQHFS